MTAMKTEGCVLHLPKCFVGHQRGHGPRARRSGRKGADVSAGREELLRGAGHQDGTDVGIDSRIVNGARERTQKRVVVAVGRRAVENDDSDAAFLFQLHRHAGTSNA